MGKFHEAQVAIKLLLDEAASKSDVGAAAEQVLSLSNPIVASLQEVSGAGGAVGLGSAAVRCAVLGGGYMYAPSPDCIRVGNS